VRGAAGAAGEAGLGNTGSSSSETSGGEAWVLRQERREERHTLRAVARRFADRTMVERTAWEALSTSEQKEHFTSAFPRDDRFLACGMRSRRSDGAVGVREPAANGVAGFSELQSCGSVWACPVCAAKIMRRRSLELGQVLTWARGQLHTIAMVTLTVRHQKSDRLRDVWDAVSTGWAAVTSGSAWVSEPEEKYQERRDRWDERRQLALEGKGRFPNGGRANTPPVRRVGDQERFGILGWARAVEVTTGANGWHVHVHAVLVLKGTRADAERNAFLAGTRMWDRWAAGLAKKGFDGLRDSGGLDVTVSRAAEKKLAEYLAKDGLTDDDATTIRESYGKKSRDVSMEATHGQAKQAKKAGGRTPFQVLAALGQEVTDEQLRRRDVAIWREWVRGSEGRRQLTWSAGLREMAGLAEAELTDEELAAVDEGGQTVLILPPATWQAVKHWQTVVLDVIEMHGVDGLRAFLLEQGLAFEDPPTVAQSVWFEEDIEPCPENWTGSRFVQ